ncbi:winged helix-turn-helix domain-containing protein [Haliea sp. E17]|uniref:winged helix-turn-helix domain-containing protein n=1 Tax=Haliea sp. E17 TaxID=3401576 RepID=UPI003AAB27A2
MSSFYLGPYEVCPEQCLLNSDGLQTKLTPRNMDVLAYLAEHANRVVTSDELLEKFWSPVASDHAVHKAISELRGALGDSVRNQHFIKTLPRRGYMLLVAPSATQRKPGKLDAFRELVWGLFAGINYRHLATGLGAVALLGVMLVLATVRQPTVATGFSGRVTVGLEPFTYRGDQTESSEFLREGLQTSLLNQLSRLKEVRVVSLDATSTDGGNPEQVDHILQGTFFEADGEQRVMVHLIRSSDGVHEYSERFDLDESGLFSVQDFIVSNIVTALSIHLDDQQRGMMYDWGTTDAIAYERFKRGDFYYNQFNPADFERAIKLYQEATRLDPNFVNAYVGLANAANNLSVFSGVSRQRELLDLVSGVHREVASRALGEAALESIRAVEMRMAGNEYRRQEQQLREQILSGNPPSYALSHYALLLIGARLYDEASRFLDLAEDQRPFELTPDESWDYRVTIAKPAEAIRRRKDQLMLRPKHIGALGPLARALYQEGREAEAQWYLDRQRDEDIDGITSDYTRLVIAVLSGKLQPGSAELDALYARGEDFNYNNGALAFMLGDLDRGINFWSQLNPLQMRRLLNVNHDSERYFPASVLENPRYAELLESLDVGKSWQRTLMEGVIAMREVTGVDLSVAARKAYTNETLVLNNTLWAAQPGHSIAVGEGLSARYRRGPAREYTAAR